MPASPVSDLHAVSKTVFLGYFSRFWAVLLSFLLTPVYIQMMGVESFAIVGLTFSIQAIFFFLDFGFGAATTNETSRLYAQKKEQALVDLFRTGSLVYWALTIFLFLLFVGASKLVTVLWLSRVPADAFDLRGIIPLMGGVVLSQWPTLFYIAALWGLQRQKVVSWLNLGIATVKGILTLLFLLFFSPTVQSFLIANIIAGLLHSFAAAWCLKKFVRGTRLTARLDPGNFMAIAKKSLKFCALSILGILLIHVDKMVLSRSLDLHRFGYYSVCWVLVYGMYGFCSTLPALFGPRFAWTHALNEEKKLAETYHQGCQWMSVLAFSGAIFFIFFSRQILLMWTHDPVLVENVRVLASLLIAGSCLHALSFIPQSFQVANHWTSLSIILQTLGIAAWVLLMIVTVGPFGVVGVGVAWIALHFVYLWVSSTLMHRRLLPGEKAVWLMEDVLKPCAGALLACLLCWLMLSPLIHGVSGAILLCFIALMTFLASALMAASIRPVMIDCAKRWIVAPIVKRAGFRN